MNVLVNDPTSELHGVTIPYIDKIEFIDVNDTNKSHCLWFSKSHVLKLPLNREMLFNQGDYLWLPWDTPIVITEDD